MSKRYGLVLSIFFVWTAASAQVPQSINYQAFLSDSSGAPVEGFVAGSFYLYTQEFGGSVIWAEFHYFNVEAGLFSVELGTVDPFPPGLFDTPLWLGIQLGNDPEMVPRRALTSSAFSFKADDALSLQGQGPAAFDQAGDVAGLDARLSTVEMNGVLTDISVDPLGHVGIGTGSPDTQLHVVGGGDATLSGGGNIVSGSISGGNVVIDTNEIMARNNGAAGDLFVNNDGGDVLMFREGTGRLGIGTGSPDTQLHVVGGGDATLSGGGNIVSGSISGGNVVIDTNEIMARNNGAAGDLFVNNDGGDVLMFRDGTGRLGIGTGSPATALDVAGTVTIRGGAHTAILSVFGPGDLLLSTGASSFFLRSNGDTLVPGKIAIGGYHVPQTALDVAGSVTIRGGADIVEGFNTADGDSPEPGTVMVIDMDNPGMLRSSGTAYDTKVAGVVSGAGGIKPGIKLGQDGLMDGDLPVAMSGRVYVRCSTENGPIQPGDRLTTSGLSGHAMRASDNGRAPGAVIGKAMSVLEEGTGLVLVLVNLQ